MIEKSPAFKDGGLIDITFDEGNPPFTYSGNSFNNANAYGPTLGDKPNAVERHLQPTRPVRTSTARNVHHEPTGPNSTLGTDAAGNQLYPGPGDNAFIDRPPSCTPDRARPACRPTACPASCAAARATARAPEPTPSQPAATSTYVVDPSIVADDTGRAVIDTVDTTGPGGTSPIPAEHVRRHGERHRPAVRPTSPPARSSTAPSSSSTRPATRSRRPARSAASR